MQTDGEYSTRRIRGGRSRIGAGGGESMREGAMNVSGKSQPSAMMATRPNASAVATPERMKTVAKIKMRELPRHTIVEYGVYSMVVVVCFFILLERGCHISDAFGPGGVWDGFAPQLQEGWIGDRRVDASDDQWRSFRSTVPGLSAVFLMCGIVSRLLKRHLSPAQIYFRAAWGCGMVLFVHGGRGWYVILLVTLTWILTRIVVVLPGASWIKIWSVWILHCGVLLSVRMSHGFHLLDGYMPFQMKEMFRWEICYNLTMLRLLSFSLDCIRAKEAKMNSNSTIRDGRRSNPRTISLPSMDFYGYIYCISHALYPPLYIAGPIITYNDFVRQVTDVDDGIPPPGMRMRSLLVYGGRLLFDIIVMEVMSHYLYFNSIAKYRTWLKTGQEFSALDVATTGWWVLACTWLKFTVIWRFFRFAALIEGIDAPENMRKCFAMNYDIQGFWKNWHASFNQWIVQYMYIPVGGSKYQMLMIWPIFFFVAIWHDIEWKLIGWASLMCLAFLPELIVKKEFKASRWDCLRSRPGLLDTTRGLLATINIAALMCANMVGFVVGMDGLVPLLQQMMASPLLIVVSLTSFYCAARLMFVSEPYIYDTVSVSRQDDK